MILDLRQMADGSRLEADLCIVGSGPAGITIARRFAHGEREVVVLESGGLEPEPEAQELNRGVVRGESYFDLRLARQRGLGGTTAHWSGAMGELTAADFAPRSWIAASGWPIEHGELATHYPEALEICGGSVWPRDPSRDASAFARDPMPPGGESWLEVRYRQHGAKGVRRFGRHFRAELAASRAVRVVLHASATELVAAPNGERVRTVVARSLEGKRLTVAARAFVLACGGLENPRLLLLSDRIVAGGLGNGRDQVGRHFQEHPVATFGDYLGLGDRLAALSSLRGVPTLLRDLCPAPAFAARERCLQFGIELRPRSERRWKPERRSPDGSRPFAADVARLLPWLTDGFDAALPGAAPALPGLWHGELGVMQEMEPESESRVTLGEERDALGCRRLVLDFRLGESFRRTLGVAARAVARELGRFSIGRLAPAPAIEAALAGERFEWQGACHHIGTTRMAADPARGVVDRDCRVHGIDNLWVAGSSVFPWGGYVNPTLTIVALALRLANHLERRLA